jgi:anti-sigma regulatory factor (Ser/Thr protein kinase)
VIVREPPLTALTSEIVTNSVRHGGSGEQDWIGFEVALSPSALRVEVADQGPGFTPDPAPPSTDDIDGRGLFLVDNSPTGGAALRAARAYGSS